MRKGTSTAVFAVAALLATALLAGMGSAGAPDRAAGRVYANDMLWATFGTPTSFDSPPAQSVDKIYVFPDNADLVPVSETAPRDRDYNGGRWEVHAVTFAAGVDPMQFTNDMDLLDAAAAGDVSISGPVMYFQCPLFAL